ncbi:MAG: S8 family serine peptidase [Clostridium sp.]|nr:S8 family serine peptidase [Clostridium sp.]
MKKLIAFFLSVSIIFGSFTFAADIFTPAVETVTKEQAYQFADELKEMNSEEYDVSNRLIVSANKDIDYLDAVDTATGIEGLYVLQFPNNQSANKAYIYYDSLSYVNYVEYDAEIGNILCNTTSKENFDFTPDCYSTVNQNIDDAIKLLNQEDFELEEIRIGVIDSGIAKTKITKSRLDGGYSFLDGYLDDGSDDRSGHGTKVSGTIILNTLDNVRLYAYQIINANGTCSLSACASAVYLAVADGCKILNNSYAFTRALSKEKSVIVEAFEYAEKMNVVCIAAASNEGKDISSIDNLLPARIDTVITVGANAYDNKIASFSNFGDGVDIYATGSGMTSYDNNGKLTNSWNGTSAAAPVISSICSLIVMVKPDIIVDEIKQLLLETGYSTNNENISDKQRITADAYGCVKNLLGKELEQVDLDYSIEKNDTTGCSDISFTSNDENAKIYYELGLGSLPAIPYQEMTGASQYKYEFGDTINLSKWHMITVAAYAPGKEKKVFYFSAPTYNDEGGYRLTQSSSTQQYNKVDRCQFIDQKVIEVPERIDGVEIQQIGDWCFIGNKTVEKIILPETVKQINRYAFANCPNLREVIAPGVEECGMYVFSNCENLVNVEMPNLTYANTGLFKNCPKLETAKLGTLTEIDNHAFYGCENLRLVKTTNDDISFAVNTFKDCNNLTIYTPDITTSMYKYAEESDIPVIISFNYKFKGKSNGRFVYEDAELEHTVSYPAQTIYKMWGTDCINQPPDYDELGFLLNTVDDNILNAKDFAVISQGA